MPPLPERDLEVLYGSLMRAPLVCVVFVGLWGLVLDVLARQRADLLSPIAPAKKADRMRVTGEHLMAVSGGLLALVLMCVYGADAAKASPAVGMGVFGLLSGVVVLLPMLAPLREGAGALFQTIEQVIFPGNEIRFSEVLVADCLTSLARVVADAGLASMYVLSVWSSGFLPSPVARAFVLGLLASIPPALRARQCIIQARGESNSQARMLHLLNTGKYCSAFPLVWLSAWAPFCPPEAPARALVGIAALVNTVYSFIWDVKMDWGLVQAGWCGGAWLRSRLVLGNPQIYYMAIAADALLRSAWALRWLPYVSSSRMDITLVLELIEVCRRCMWSVFRLEWEYIRNTSLPSSSSSLDLESLLPSSASTPHHTPFSSSNGSDMLGAKITAKGSTVFPLLSPLKGSPASPGGSLSHSIEMTGVGGSRPAPNNSGQQGGRSRMQVRQQVLQ